MSTLTVNLLPEDQTPDEPKRRLPWRPLLTLIAVIGAFCIVAAILISLIGGGLASSLSGFNLFGQFGRLITSGDRQLQGEAADRINVILIGIGGDNHEGGTLADTIIAGSIKPSTGQVAMMSIPRDMSVPARDGGWIKINAVHAYAERDADGSGGEATRETLTSLLGTEFHYFAVIDFDGFEKLIDEFGGVDVNVERTLVDYQYPIRGQEDAYPIESRYETLRIEQGQQHLDGATALKYARSRHAIGGEGSDFARSKRQQKIIQALKDKVFSFETLLNPGHISKLLNTYRDHVTTNMELWELMRLGQVARDLDTTSVISQSLDDSRDGLLYSTIANGAYVLLPRGGNYDLVKERWQNIFNSSSTPLNIPDAPPSVPRPTSTTPITTSTAPATTATTTATSSSAKLTGTVAIYNGTFVAGWASQERDRLRGFGFTVADVGNAPTRDYTSVHIYSTATAHVATAAKLREIYKVSTIEKTRPAGISTTADFTIILGK